MKETGVLAAIKTEPAVALRSSLDRRLRSPALRFERPGRGNRSAGAELENEWGQRSGDLPARFPHVAREHGNGKCKREVATNRLSSRSRASPQSAGEAIAVVGLDDPAGGSQRGKPLVEGSSTDAAMGAQLGEEERSMSLSECGSDALVERIGYWRRGF